jgi:hypothetical protein
MTSKDRCPACRFEKLYRCTRKRGHEGDHTAWVPASDTHSERQAWPQKARKPQPPKRSMALRKLAPGRYADPVTGRFEVRRSHAGGLYESGFAWRWVDTHSNRDGALNPSVCGPWRATKREAEADLAAHDSSRSALDILKGWQ